MKSTTLPINIPLSYNYIAVFLIFRCNYKCSYCINYFEVAKFSRKIISGKEWIKALNRINSRPDLPLTLQGGEPTIHKDFYEIVNNIKQESNIDLLTNLQFDIYDFMKNVKPDRMKREAPYASIRVSYHPEQTNEEELIEKVLIMQERGYSIGIWGVLHPNYENKVLAVQKVAQKKGIDFRTKEFLGFHEGKLYGKYKYPGAAAMKDKKNCICKTTELLLDSEGLAHRCHHDLYEGYKPIGDIKDDKFQIEDKFRPCSVYGFCNPCDIKLKTNRFQHSGHTSVEIVFEKKEFFCDGEK